jgi:hypothetical protein
MAPERDRELVAQQQVLDDQIPVGAQAGAEDGKEEAERLNHRPGMSDRNAGRSPAPTFAPRQLLPS